jgi:hypothetical protein
MAATGRRDFMPAPHGRLWLAGLIGIAGVACALSADPVQKNPPKEAAKDDGPVPVAAARQQARLMHKVYAATLDSMHHHYFRRDRAVLPARALEDVFAEMERESNVKARWLSVNTKAMSIQHEPKSEFDKKAATTIAAGKEEFEQVEDGYYHRAAAIPLGSGCVSCHTGFFSNTPNTPRFAALVISVPVRNP